MEHVCTYGARSTEHGAWSITYPVVGKQGCNQVDGGVSELMVGNQEKERNLEASAEKSKRALGMGKEDTKDTYLQCRTTAKTIHRNELHYLEQ